MTYEVKPNTGSLFKNDRKESDSHPDYKGSAVIGGVEGWLDAWINTSANGVKYMSLKFKPKDAPQQTASQAYAGVGGADDDDSDSVPF